MSKRILYLLLTVCLVISLIASFMSGCQGNSGLAAVARVPQKHLGLAAELNEYMTAYNDNCSLKYSGAVLVAKGDEILLDKGYGMANYKENIPNRPDNVYGIGSISKSFTATAVMQLQEKGLLNVNDPISKYIKGNKRGDDITIHHLLTHTSGLPRDGLKFGSSDVPLYKNIDFINAAQLLFEPGEKYSYSNEGYILLAAIIEKVSGKSYNDYIRDNIFKPLNMDSSRCGIDNSYGNNQAAAYELLTGEPKEVPLASFSYAIGCGNIYSTVEDLYKYDRALYGEKLLSRKSLDKMFTSYSDGTHGYGWGISQRFGVREISHTGHIEGYYSIMIRFPEDDTVIILLSNNNDGKALNEVSGALAAIALGQDYIMPGKLNAVEVNAETLKKYEGKYKFKEGFCVTIACRDGKLYQKMDDGSLFELLPLNVTEFYPRDLECSRARFIMDENNNTIGLETISSSIVYKGKKVKE